MRREVAWGLLVLLGLRVEGLPAAPQTFNTALPVAEDEFVFREQLLYLRATDDPGPADRELTVLGAVSVLGFGVTGRLAVFGLLPYLDKELELTTPTGDRITRDTTGVADAQFFARYTAYQKDAPGRTFRIATFLGLELPAGDDDDTDSLGTLPAPLQLGSGSTDPLGGVVVTWQTHDYQVDAQASYQINNEANGFEFGNVARLDASLQYRLWPRELGSGMPAFVYGVLEGNVIRQSENEIAGTEDADSGGTTFFLSPGVQYVTRRWIVEAIVQVPVGQDLNGMALEDDFAVRAGFRVKF
ncbi:MAG: transporter [Woeseia sp.]